VLPRGVREMCDALYWKGLSGYDFSAYAIAISEVANRSPTADLYVMNDSVFGPLYDIEQSLTASKWDLLGFSATSAFENHVQSYAFFLRNVTSERVKVLSKVLSIHFAFDRFQDVVNCQETRFARVASSKLSVGALWYEGSGQDPSLIYGPSLVAAGFPFLKRSLTGKNRYMHNEDELHRLLEERGHPIPKK
jgi:hypothetical protein